MLINDENGRLFSLSKDEYYGYLDSILELNLLLDKLQIQVIYV